MLMSQAEITQQDQQKYLISGVVDFSTVPDLLRRASAFLVADNSSSGSRPSDRRHVIVDLSQVEESNSAALALILEIVKSARQKKIEVQFENLPQTILTIAKAYGLENEIRDLCK
jgi:phospholipid transport system transporter-binding protein